MKYKILGKTDLKVSELGFGCQSLGGGLYHRDDKESIMLVNSIQRIIDILKENPQFGDPIAKRLIPIKSKSE